MFQIPQKRVEKKLLFLYFKEEYETKEKMIDNYIVDNNLVKINAWSAKKSRKETVIFILQR